MTQHKHNQQQHVITPINTQYNTTHSNNTHWSRKNTYDTTINNNQLLLHVTHSNTQQYTALHSSTYTLEQCRNTNAHRADAITIYENDKRPYTVLTRIHTPNTNTWHTIQHQHIRHRNTNPYNTITCEQTWYHIVNNTNTQYTATTQPRNDK